MNRNHFGLLAAALSFIALLLILPVFTDRDDPEFFLEDDPEIRAHPDYPVQVIDVDRLENDVIIERNVKVRMPDDTPLSANIFLPSRPGAYPVVMAFTAYDKNKGPDLYPKLLRHSLSEEFDLGKFSVSPWASWEGPDPAYWVPNGYAVVLIDSRGYASSKGSPSTLSQQDRDDFYHAIEWVAEQDWSNGNVGLTGVSYLAISQWVAASGNPPGLKAIIPWEGQTDSYREVLYHGGIPETTFTSFWIRKVRSGANGNPLPPPTIFKFAHRRPELMRRVQQRPATRSGVDLPSIKVPALIAATWSDQGLHSRGSFEGFKQIASEQKWLFTHGRQKWEVYYSEEGLSYQKDFFDHFLKEQNNGFNERPAVRLEVRESRDEYRVRYVDDWPIPDTEYVELYLDSDNGKLSTSPGTEKRNLSYDPLTETATFSIQFNEDTELSGNMKLKLWVATSEGDDMDLFVAVDKLDREGNKVDFFAKMGYLKGPVSLGWLRVSQRALDKEKSTPWQPVLSHAEAQPIKINDVVPVEIEILPSSTLFRAGETLVLSVQGRDFFEHPSLGHGYPVNQGLHSIHTGGPYDSHLLIPVAPL